MRLRWVDSESMHLFPMHILQSRPFSSGFYTSVLNEYMGGGPACLLQPQGVRTPLSTYLLPGSENWPSDAIWPGAVPPPAPMAALYVDRARVSSPVSSQAGCSSGASLECDGSARTTSPLKWAKSMACQGIFFTYPTPFSSLPLVRARRGAQTLGGNPQCRAKAWNAN